MKKYYIINNGDLAKTINYITGIRYEKQQDKFIENKLIYVFEDTIEFRKALTYINLCRKKYKNE